MTGGEPEIEAAKPTPPDYAESVMMVLFSPDGRRDLSVRLWRLIHQHKATIWGAYSDEAGSFRMADEAPLPEAAAPTDVDQDRAAFSHLSSWRSQFERRGHRTAHMHGQVLLAAGLHASSDPPPGEGPLPALIHAGFRAVHARARAAGENGGLRAWPRRDSGGRQAFRFQGPGEVA